MFESRKRIPPGAHIELSESSQKVVSVSSPIDGRRMGVGKIIGKLCHERDNLVIRLDSQDSISGAVDLLDSECNYQEITEAEIEAIATTNQAEIISPQKWADFIDDKYLSLF